MLLLVFLGIFYCAHACAMDTTASQDVFNRIFPLCLSHESAKKHVIDGPDVMEPQDNRLKLKDFMVASYNAGQKTLTLQDITKHDEQHVMRDVQSKPTLLEYDSEGKKIAIVYNDREINIRSLKASSACCYKHTFAVAGMFFPKKSDVLVISDTVGGCVVWHILFNDQDILFNAHEQKVVCFTELSDGRIIVGRERSFVIYDIYDLDLKNMLTIDQDQPIIGMASLPENRLAIASEKEIKIWNMQQIDSLYYQSAPLAIPAKGIALLKDACIAVQFPEYLMCYDVKQSSDFAHLLNVKPATARRILPDGSLEVYEAVKEGDNVLHVYDLSFMYRFVTDKQAKQEAQKKIEKLMSELSIRDPRELNACGVPAIAESVLYDILCKACEMDDDWEFIEND